MQDDRQSIDRDWFFKTLEANGKSVRGLARHLDIDASAASRMLAGQRRMKMEEASRIAMFLNVHVREVLAHAGVAVDVEGEPTRVLLAATIDGKGTLHRLPDPKPLPTEIIERARGAIIRRRDRTVMAAQVRVAKGPLSLLDDAIVLFDHTERVEPEAIGALSICRTKEGRLFLGRLRRARKTGEAFCESPDGGPTGEVMLLTAAPVLAIIP